MSLSMTRVVGLVGRRNWRVSPRELLQGVGGEWVRVPRSRPLRQGKLPLVPHKEVGGHQRNFLSARRYVGPRIKSWPTPLLFRGPARPLPWFSGEVVR